MIGRRAGARQVFREAVKEQRVSLACAITVAVVLVGIFRAPVGPVLVGCGAALAVLLAWACRRLLSKVP